MKKTNINKWLAQAIKDESLRAKSLIVTVFGDTIAPHGGSIWLGDLISLMMAFDVSERLVRTSVFRLAEDGWLEAQREGRRSIYRITLHGQRRFERAHQRIYEPLNQKWNSSWTVVFCLTGGMDAVKRGALRKEMLWEGFCAISPNLFVHAGDHSDAVKEIIDRIGVNGQIFVGLARDLGLIGAKPFTDLVEHGWTMTPVKVGYDQFIEKFQRLSELLKSEHTISPEQSFIIRTLLIHAFRRVELNDPRLPIELLSINWSGTEAYELCKDLYKRVFSSAELHLNNTLCSGISDLKQVAPYFYQRFGGLL